MGQNISIAALIFVASCSETKPAPQALPSKPSLRHQISLAPTPTKRDGHVLGATSLSASQSDAVHAVAINEDGAVWTAGHFTGDYQRRTSEGADVFITRSTSTAQEILVFQGPGEDSALGIASGNAETVVVGSFQKSLTAGENRIFTPNATGAFVASLTPSGVPQWLKALAPQATKAKANAVVLDASRNIYVAGEYQGIFETGAPASDDKDGFVVKLAPDGSVQWKSFLPGQARQKAVDVKLDGNNFLYVLVEYERELALDSPILSEGNSDIAVVIYDPSGRIYNVHHLGGPEDELPRGIAVAPNGDFTIVGGHEGSLTLGPYAFHAVHQLDVLIIHYAHNGTLRWAKSMGGAGNDMAYSASADNSGDIAITGWFSERLLTPKQTLNSKGNSDLFVMKFDSQGNFIWTLTAGGNDHDQGRAINANLSAIYVGGLFRKQIKLQEKTLTPHPQEPNHLPEADSFWLHLSP